jgi:hypothetical protein
MAHLPVRTYRWTTVYLAVVSVVIVLLAALGK